MGQDEQVASSSAGRLLAARLDELLAEYETLESRESELERLRRIYEENRREAVEGLPAASGSIEDWTAAKTDHDELLRSSDEKIAELDGLLASVEDRRQSLLGTLLYEGLPEGRWVGVGAEAASGFAGEKCVLVERTEENEARRADVDTEQSGGRLLLRRAPARAVARAAKRGKLSKVPPVAVVESAKRLAYEPYASAAKVLLFLVHSLGGGLVCWGFFSLFGATLIHHIHHLHEAFARAPHDNLGQEFVSGLFSFGWPTWCIVAGGALYLAAKWAGNKLPGYSWEYLYPPLEGRGTKGREEEGSSLRNEQEARSSGVGGPLGVISSSSPTEGRGRTGDWARAAFLTGDLDS